MHWTKKTIRLTTWTAFNFTIQHTGDVEGRPFRLDAPGQRPAFFATLRDAQRHAALQNELEMVREDNARLRRELHDDQRDDPHADLFGDPPVLKAHAAAV